MTLTVEQLKANAWGGPYRDRSWRGLTAQELVTQSYLCHPDWDADTHAVYLVAEEPFDPEYVAGLPLEQWLTRLRAGQPI